MSLKPAELILNSDQSIYHLNLLPSEIAPLVITVGDPDRVEQVSKYFDVVELRKQKREFTTHTGYLNKHRISVVSTGIGTDNIDIVINELDALVNIDFETRTILPKTTSLDIVRIGTSGAIQGNIPIDSFLLSEYAIGLDSLLHFYKSDAIQHKEIQLAFIRQTQWVAPKADPYVVQCDMDLAERLKSDQLIHGFTATNVGFYGPQGRRLRLDPSNAHFNDRLADFDFRGMRITNMEMETSGIYGLAKLLGHRAVSLNCILANRSSGEFSKDPDKAMDRLISYTLEKLTSV